MSNVTFSFKERFYFNTDKHKLYIPTKAALSLPLKWSEHWFPAERLPATLLQGCAYFPFSLSTAQARVMKSETYRNAGSAVRVFRKPPPEWWGKPSPPFHLTAWNTVDVMTGAGKHLSHKAKGYIVVTENCSHSLLGDCLMDSETQWNIRLCTLW